MTTMLMDTSEMRAQFCGLATYASCSPMHACIVQSLIKTRALQDLIEERMEADGTVRVRFGGAFMARFLP